MLVNKTATRIVMNLKMVSPCEAERTVGTDRAGRGRKVETSTQIEERKSQANKRATSTSKWTGFLIFVLLPFVSC